MGEWPSGTSHTTLDHRQAGRTGAREAEGRKLLSIAKRMQREGGEAVAEPEVEAPKTQLGQAKASQSFRRHPSHCLSRTRCMRLGKATRDGGQGA